MSKLQKNDILKLASLSRFKLTEQEVLQFQNELSAILNYVEKLDSVDTKNYQPTYQVTGLKNVFREDELKNYGYKTETLLELNAPDTKDGQFRVKRVL